MMLGFRFDRVCERAGSDGLFTCRAQDALLGRPVSLHVCTPSAAVYERERFEREADALHHLGSHPAVVEFLDVATYREVRMLVLEDASSGIERGVSPRAAVRAVIWLAGAVETAHHLGLLHGAIEPDNVWTAASGRGKLAGFTGRVDDEAPPVLTTASPHTAPEVLLGEPLDAAVDVYGLGSTLYELITGTSAIRSYDGESAAALSLRVLTGTTAGHHRADVPYELADVIGWSMAVDRADRPPSVAWLAEELGRIERSQGWPRTRLHIGDHHRAS